jgi:hypothetical protein
MRLAFVRRFRNRNFRTLVVIVVSILILCPLLLACLGWALEYDDERPIQSNIVVLDDSFEEFQAIADCMAEDPNRICWIVDKRPDRSVRIGAIDSIPQTRLADLKRLGVDPERCRIIQTDATQDHQLIREFASHPQTRGESFTLLVSAFRGRYWHHVIDQSLMSEESVRFSISPHRTVSMSPTRWFLNRHGGKVVQYRWLELLFVTIVGESQYDPIDPYANVFPLAEPSP